MAGVTAGAALASLARTLTSLLEDRAELQWLRDRLGDQDPTTESPEKDEYLLHSLMENLPQNIYFKDKESRFTRVNRAMATALGSGATIASAVELLDADTAALAHRYALSMAGVDGPESPSVTLARMPPIFICDVIAEPVAR